MTENRWRALMWAGCEFEDIRLTADEVKQGWHFCREWDGLLIGPGMKNEWECCSCDIKYSIC